MVSSVIPMGNKDKVYSGGQQKHVKRILTIDGDPRVDDLMLEFINFSKRTIYWEYRSKFIEVAQDLLKSRTNWFLLQDHNNMMSDLKIDFLADTVRFIFTGRRKFAITAWGDLLGADNGNSSDVMKRKTIYNQCKLLNIETGSDLEINNFIQNWLSQERGFDDMVFSIYYLFGTKTKNIK